MAESRLLEVEDLELSYGHVQALRGVSFGVEAGQIVAIVGGTGAFWGPMLGSTVLTVLPEVLRFLRDYRLIFNGLVLLFIILFLPDGLISLAEWRPRGRAAATQPAVASLDAVEA